MILQNSSQFYVTKCLEKHGYKHDFPEIVKNFDFPHDTQLRSSGSCFCLSAVVMRRIMAILDPDGFEIGGTKESGQKFLIEKFGDKSSPLWGYPHEAFEKLISKPYEQIITDRRIEGIVEYCKKWPVVLPYCPPPSSGELTKISREDYMRRMYDIGVEYLNGKPSLLHSMCVAGTLKEDNQSYFICVQTWENCKVVLVPIITNEEFIREYEADRAIARVIDLNKIYTHTTGSPFIKTEIPPKEPLSFHQAFCAIPKWIEPAIW